MFTNENPSVVNSGEVRAKKRKVILRRRTSVLLQVCIVCAIAAIGTITAFIIPLRPSVSESEKRELTEFPEFSYETLFDGSYFGGISTWFSDTFPFRDKIVELNSRLKSFIGIGSAIYNPDIGNKGDVIPSEFFSGEDVILDSVPAAEQPSTVPGETAVTGQPEVTSAAQADAPLGVTQSLGAILIYEDAAYEYYTFVQNTANAYVTAINKCAAGLAGKANVYCMIIPTSTDITLNDAVRAKVSSDSQLNAINYMLGSMNSSVKKVDVYDILRQHRNEYIYFRTDHHWNGTGAYYAYVKFCEVKGITALPLEKFEVYNYDNFLGSFYSDSNKNPSLATNPDTVNAYAPPCKTSVTVTEMNGNTLSVHLINDVSKNNSSNKYGTFIYGDNPFTVIENTDMASGESCIVVKESFGNAMVPFLAYYYKYVYVIDYRYYVADIPALVAKYGVNDVIFANNISMTRSSSLVASLQKSTVN